MKRIIVAGSLAALFAAAPALAQDATAPKAPMAASVQKSDVLMGKPVYSSDGKNLGTVAVVVRDSDGKASKVDADIGGFLGIGQHRIALTPSQFTIGVDDVKLLMTAEQAKALPAVTTN